MSKTMVYRPELIVVWRAEAERGCRVVNEQAAAAVIQWCGMQCACSWKALCAQVLTRRRYTPPVNGYTHAHSACLVAVPRYESAACAAGGKAGSAGYAGR